MSLIFIPGIEYGNIETTKIFPIYSAIDLVLFCLFKVMIDDLPLPCSDKFINEIIVSFEHVQ